jgi:hypothetical protein
LRRETTINTDDICPYIKVGFHPKNETVAFATMSIVKMLYIKDVGCRISLIIVLPYLQPLLSISEDSPLGVPFLTVGGKWFCPIGGGMPNKNNSYLYLYEILFNLNKSIDSFFQSSFLILKTRLPLMLSLLLRLVKATYLCFCHSL